MNVLFMFCIKQYWVTMIFSIRHNKLSCVLGKYNFRGMGHVFFIINILHKWTKKCQCYFLSVRKYCLCSKQMSEAACLHSDSDSHCSPKPWITYESQSHPVLLSFAVYTIYEGFVQPSYFSSKSLLSCQSDCSLTSFFLRQYYYLFILIPKD